MQHWIKKHDGYDRNNCAEKGCPGQINRGSHIEGG